MKRITKTFYLVAIALLLLSSNVTSSNAQTSFDEPVQPFRDNAIQRADFQQDLGDVDRIAVPNELNSIGSADSNFEESIDESTQSSPIDSILNKLSGHTTGIDFPKVVSSLGIVIGGYLGFVWLTRRLNPSGNGGLPSEVVEVLGQTPFGTRKQLQLVRLGSKLLLLLNNQDGSTQTIGEITDPHEVDYLSSICGNRNTNRSAIAISKASSNKERNEVAGNELKRVLRQLQQSGEPGRVGSVFDA